MSQNLFIFYHDHLCVFICKVLLDFQSWDQIQLDLALDSYSYYFIVLSDL